MKRQHGFTLIELIIVVGVILIISVVTILNYNSYTDKQRVKQAGFTLRSDLRLARTKATSGQKTPICDALLSGDPTTRPTLESYEVTFNADCAGKGPCYETKPICSRDGSPLDTTTDVMRIFLPPSVSYETTYSPIRFFTVTGKTDLIADQIIVLKGAGVTYSVRVTPSGVISDY